MQNKPRFYGGDTFKFAGFAFPLQYLNGGELHLPDSALAEDIVIDVQIPDYGQIAANAVGFGDSIASAVRFEVSRNDTVISPYYFEIPVELTLPISENLPPMVGDKVSELVFSYRDTTGVNTVIRDSVLRIIKAEVAHFSDIVMIPREIARQVATGTDNIFKQTADGFLHFSAGWSKLPAYRQAGVNRANPKL